MQTIGKPVLTPAYPAKQTTAHFAGSVAIHIVTLLLLTAILHRTPPWIAPYRLPGSENGHNFVVAYMPDRAPEQSAVAKAKVDPKSADPKSLLPTRPAQPAKPSILPSVNTLASPDPNSATGADALGSGNITIALSSYFPAPHPDLSVLPHGTKGDVILDVVIDTNGRISELKKTSGLGYGIDELVITTVQQWIFHPALQNGRPVASEQELHFHYERS